MGRRERVYVCGVGRGKEGRGRCGGVGGWTRPFSDVAIMALFTCSSLQSSSFAHLSSVDKHLHRALWRWSHIQLDALRVRIMHVFFFQDGSNFKL